MIKMLLNVFFSESSLLGLQTCTLPVPPCTAFLCADMEIESWWVFLFLQGYGTYLINACPSLS